MDEYGLSMPIRFIIDDHSFDEIKDAFVELKLDDASLKLIARELSDNTAALKQLTAVLSSSSATSQGASNSDNATDADEVVAGDSGGFGFDTDAFKAAMLDGLKKGGIAIGVGALSILGAGLTKIWTSFVGLLKDTFTGAWKELDTMLQSSLLTNQTTRENAFNYGMSASESYGFEKAKSMLGISSEEDLWYMNDQQKSKFQEIMTRYAEKYTELADKGFFEKQLDFQIEMQELKLDMQMEVIEFFMDHKDTIVKGFEIIMWGMETIVNLLDGVIGLLSPDDTTSEEARTANINSILREYTNNNQINVSQTNNATFNGATDSQVRSYTDTLSASLIENIKALE